MKINKIGKKIGVAVSGGIDSMVLLRLLEQAEEDFIVINFEHGIRGEESNCDSEFVKRYCEERSLPFLGISFNTLQESKIRGVSVELAARQKRNEEFEKLLQDGTVEGIALAHHASDNTETMLMRILRGTGIKGLAGMQETAANYIRPLIDYSRQEIEEYAQKHNVHYREDATNKDTEYTRNFLRIKVIPLLKERYPALDESFARLRENATETTDLVESLLIPFEKSYGTQGETFYLDIPSLLAVHPLVRKESAVKLLSAMGVCQDIEHTHREAINELITKENGARINLPFGITAIKEYDKLVFFREKPLGMPILPFLEAFPLSFNGMLYTLEKTLNVISGCCFDLSKIPCDAIVRTRLDGDRFKRCGGRTKKLNDFLTDIKYPLKDRDTLLVIASGTDILLIIGIEISDRVKIDENTKEIYYIKKECK